jgi:hypothetical protein
MDEKKIIRHGHKELAATILAKNLPVEVQQNPRRPRRADFVSPDNDAIRKAIEEFNSNQAIPIQDFLESLEVIRDRMTEVLKGGKP